MRRLILVVVLFIGVLNLKAQYFQTGQDPASIKWRQINTENFQLIYPDYYELQAQRLAQVMEKVYAYGSKSMAHKPQKISIILHTQTVQSNGLVAYAPKRSEFYTTPHQGIYPQEWLEQLALHEFRHVVQIDKLNSEIPKIIKILLGEQGTALVFGAFLPWWFIEGDAVVTETVMSKFGRGRFPSFLMENRAQVVEKGVYKYDKAYNGSVKDFIPDHYKLGYYLVGSTRDRYGVGVWDSVLTRVGTKPFSLNPFNKALKIQTGFNKVELYNSVFDSLKNVWTVADKKYVSAAFKTISSGNKTFTNYKYNHWLNDSTIVSYKTSLNEIPKFITIDLLGKEETILKPGRIFSESVNCSGDWLVWAEQIPDLRWQHSGESLIRLYNLKSSAKNKISPEYKAFSPAISPNKELVILVETDFSSNNYLSVYNIGTGELVHRIHTKNNYFFFSPKWLGQNEVVAVALFPEGKRIVKFNLNSDEMTLLSNREMGEIKSLTVAKTKLFFVSSYTGKNGLYCMDLNNNSISQVYEPRFGADYPAISHNGENIVFSDYTGKGFRLLEIAVNKTDSISNIPKSSYLLANKLSEQESGILNLSTIDTIQYSSKKYGKTAHLFNFHSWAPVSIDVNSYDISPGVSLMSQNKLGTAETVLGYEWDVAEKTGKMYAKYIYRGWYPVFNFELNSGNRASNYYLIEQTQNSKEQIVDQDTTIQRFTWKETNFNLDMRIPLNFTRGKYFRLFQPEMGYSYTLYKHDNSTPENFVRGNSQRLSYRLYYQQILRQSEQDLFPDFGWIADINYYHTPFGETNLGSMAFAQAILYLPGLSKNHGIRCYAGGQLKEPVGSRGFSDAIRYPRGWGKINTTQMISVALDYKLPLFYPEWSAWGIAYLKRVNASVFADFADLKGNSYNNGEIVGTFASKISSYGVELTGDMNFLRFYAPVEIGFRASYLPEDERVYFDFLLSIDFESL